MFTGIIESLGVVSDVKRSDNLLLCIDNPFNFDDIKRGSSISVNGVCLTALEIGSAGVQRLTFEISSETASRSNLGKLTKGHTVNLERALQASGRFDGHIVLGHVDMTVKLKGNKKVGSDNIYEFSHNGQGKYLVEKGSVALNGISLTVFDVKSGSFSCVVLPYTLEKTNLKNLKPGDELNCEMDVLGKYIEKFSSVEKNKKKIDREFLAKHGF